MGTGVLGATAGALVAGGIVANRAMKNRKNRNLGRQFNK
jgi:hypothetical protein